MSARRCGCRGGECGGTRRESRSAGTGARTDGQVPPDESGESGPGEGEAREMDRREFVAAAAVGGMALATSMGGIPFVAGPFYRQEGVDHFVPADKRLNPQWVRALFGWRLFPMCPSSCYGTGRPGILVHPFGSFWRRTHGWR